MAKFFPEPRRGEGSLLFLEDTFPFKEFLRKFNEKNNIKLAISLIFIFLAIGTIVFIFFVYYFTQLEHDLYEKYHLIWKIGIIFQLSGFGFFFLVSEHRVFHGKDYFIFFWGFLGFFIAGAWPSANPAPAVLEAFGRSGSAERKLDFPDALRTHSRVVLRGLIAQTEA